MQTLAEVLIILALILVNGYFSAAEIAVLTARRNRLAAAASEGSRGAKSALALLGDSNQFLSTVQIGITTVGSFAAAYGGISLVEQLAAHLREWPHAVVSQNSEAIALTLVTATIAFVTLVLGELVPKNLALANPEGLAAWVAPPMRALGTLARPIIAVLGYATRGVLVILRVKPQEESRVTVDDIAHLIETGKSQGVIAAAEHEVALEALRLRNRRVREIMRPRIDIDAVDVDTPADEIVGVVAMAGFSRLPVYEGDLDHIIGFVYNKDLFQQSFLHRTIDLRKSLRQPLFIPDNLTLDRLLVLFQTRRTQLAIVLDEFGGTRGMVTFEDVLEELVGDIHDEHRRDEEQLIVRRDETSWLIDGQIPVSELLQHVPETIAIPQDMRSAATVAGVVLSSLAELPKIADVVTFGVVKIEVVDMDGQRIDRLLISITPSE